MCETREKREGSEPTCSNCQPAMPNSVQQNTVTFVSPSPTKAVNLVKTTTSGALTLTSPLLPSPESSSLVHHSLCFFSTNIPYPKNPYPSINPLPNSSSSFMTIGSAGSSIVGISMVPLFNLLCSSFNFAFRLKFIESYCGLLFIAIGIVI